MPDGLPARLVARSPFEKSQSKQQDTDSVAQRPRRAAIRDRIREIVHKSSLDSRILSSEGAQSAVSARR